MKRLLLSLLLAAAGASASAMNYTDAREYAYFLTDKMAYELNLTPTQYDQVYQVNLDYFLSVNSPYDLYGRYRDYRDDDLRYILYDWQYARYVGVDYFYRPLSWTGSSFIFNVYTRYSYRDRFFFDKPSVYISYRGSDWGYRRPEYRSPYYGLRVVESRYGGLRDSYVARYGDRGYSSYYRNEPLRIVEGRYGGRGWSYDTGNSYYGGGAYSSPRYEGSSYDVPSYNGSYAPSRQYEGGGVSGRRGTVYGSGSYDSGNSGYNYGSSRSYEGARSNYSPTRSDYNNTNSSGYTSGRRGSAASSQSSSSSSQNYNTGSYTRSGCSSYSAPAQPQGGSASSSGVTSGRR